MSLNRRKSRTENDRGVKVQFKTFKGQNTDLPASILPEGDLPLLENAIAYGDRIEPHPGSFLWGTAATSSQSRGFFYHQKTKKFLTILPGPFTTNLLMVSDASSGTPGAWAEVPLRYLSGNVTGTAFATNTNDADGFIPYGNGALFVNYEGMRYIDLVGGYWRWVGGMPFTTFSVSSSGAYVYRYIITWSRITGGADRITGTLESESAPCPDIDYTEVKKTAAIGSSSLVFDYAVGGVSSLPPPSLTHFTHISVYRTLDIGVNGVDPISGAGNDTETYVWVGDFANDPAGVILTTVTDSISDSTLRARIAAGGYLCPTRFWFDMFYDRFVNFRCNATIVGSFLFTAVDSTLYYCQLAKSHLVGYYNPGVQFKKFNSPIKRVLRSGNVALILCESEVHACDTNAYKNVSSGEAVFALLNFWSVSANLGVNTPGSFAEIQAGTFIGRFSDGSIRTWDGTQLSKDLAEERVQKTLKTMADIAATPACVGAYDQGAYYLYYAPPASLTGLISYTNFLRIALERRAGVGWSSGTLSVEVYQNTRPIPIVDANGYYRLVSLSQNRRFVWLNTYDGPAGSGIARTYRRNQTVGNPSSGTTQASRVLLPEMTGEEESFKCVHQLTHLYLRPAYAIGATSAFTQDSNGYESGFSVDFKGYSEGALAATTTSVDPKGELEFFAKVQGRRIQIEFDFNAGGWVLVGADTHYRVIDKKNPQRGTAQTAEAGYQLELASNLLYWTDVKGFSRDRASPSSTYVTYGAPYADGTPSGEESSFLAGPGGIAGVASVSLLGSGRVRFIPQTTLGDFTLCGWIYSPSFTFPIDVILTDEFGLDLIEFYFETATTLRVWSGGVPVVDAAVSNVSDSAWHWYVVCRSGSVVTVFQDGVQKASITFATTLSVNKMDLWFEGLSFDMRAYSAELSAGARAYYYNDILNNAGAKVLPLL